MKVIHLVPSMQSGGVEQVVMELGRSFSQRGIDNTVISAGGRLVSLLEEGGTRHITMPIGKKSLTTLALIPRLASVLKREKPDILHIHSRVPAWIAFPALKLLDRRPKTVTTVHGFYSINAYSAVMAKGQRVIAVSECVKNYITTHYPKTDPKVIRIIPNSINPDEYYRGFRIEDAWRDDWKRQFPELAGKYTLCLPGRLTRIKGQEDLVPILTGLLKNGIDAHAVIVGEAKKGKEAYKQELVRRFDDAGLTSNVTWTGHRQDLREIIAVCDATLSLSTSPESFGKSTLEALALGKPVVGYSHGGVEEQLSSILPAGLVPVRDTDAVIAKLSDWRRAGPPVPARIPTSYRLEGMIQHHIDTYTELLRYDKS